MGPRACKASKDEGKGLLDIETSLGIAAKNEVQIHKEPELAHWCSGKKNPGNNGKNSSNDIDCL